MATDLVQPKVGYVTPTGNFKLVKQIESLDEFWKVINTDKSIFARHRIYPSAFFHSWQIKLINDWIQSGYFFTVNKIIK